MLLPKIFNEDCHQTMRNRMADNSIDLIVTSPPYYNARPEYAEYSSYEEYHATMMYLLREMRRVLKPNGRICVNVPDGYGRSDYIPIYSDFVEGLKFLKFKLRGSIVWYKGNNAVDKTSWGSWCSSSNPSLIDVHEMIIIAHKDDPSIENKGQTIESKRFMDSVKSVWQINPETNRDHPAPYPVELPYRLIELYSNKGDIVYDPFMGSGTTAIAAMMLNRNCVGSERDEGYYKYALGRIDQNYTPESIDDLLFQ